MDMVRMRCCLDRQRREKREWLLSRFMGMLTERVVPTIKEKWEENKEKKEKKRGRDKKRKEKKSREKKKKKNNRRGREEGENERKED